MSFWDAVGEGVFAAFECVEAVGRGVDRVVTSGLDSLGQLEDSAVEFFKEHPKTAIAAVTVVGGAATGGLGYVFAPAVASFLGSAGILGAASTGAAIEGLAGAALANASLAAIGGGSLAAGGAGMAGGTAVIATVGAGVGATASGGVSASVKRG